MKNFIWQNPQYPNFTYDKEKVFSLLAEVKLKQGFLLGKMANIGFENNSTAVLNVLTEDVIKSGEIEGVKLNEEQVRSSIAKKLGLDTGADVLIERNVEGIVEMMLDATRNFDRELTEERLFAWQAAMFPGGYSGLNKIVTGNYRDDKNGVMQVVSGAIGHEKIHYEAPPAKSLIHEMNALFDFVNNEKNTDLIIKAGIVHLWFVIIHPFEDGNGRIARALTDMILARSENSSDRFYSMSSQIKRVRKSYYQALEITRHNSVDITSWLIWFLQNMSAAIDSSENLLKGVWQKVQFWKDNKDLVLNARQIKVLNKLFDGLEGKLTTGKWAKICNCSQDTASRDINDLIQKGILIKQGEARSTHYIIYNFS